MKKRKITILAASLLLAAILAFGCGGGGDGAGDEDESKVDGNVETSKSMVGKFPSTLVAVFNADGFGWAVPTDPDILNSIPAEYRGNDKEIEWVKKWQVDHADICLSCEDISPELNKQITLLDYNYFQAMRENTHFEEAEMRKRLIIDGKALDWENLFLHFNTDTFVDSDEICEDKATWAGRPFVGYLNDKNKDAGAGLPFEDQNDPEKPITWSLDVFADNGVLYIGMPEKFDKIIVDIKDGGTSGNGTLTFEYAAGIDPATITTTERLSETSRAAINKWQPLNLASDGTANFTKDGEIKFKPPSDWTWGTPYPAYFPGIYENGVLLLYGSGRYFIRIKVGKAFNKNPVLEKITTRPWITIVDYKGKKAIKIPGWDPKNDTNKDGYIDDNELKASTYNNKASARFVHEGRVAQVCTMGKGSNPYWGRFAPNLWDDEYITLRSEATAKRWKDAGITGNYNDNANALLWGSFSRDPLSTEADNGPALLGGGTITEGKVLGYGTGNVRDATMAQKYTQGFIDMWAKIKEKTASSWIGINTVEPYRHPLMKPFIESSAFDLFLNENTIRAVIPFNENMGSQVYGFSKLWFIPSTVKTGKKFVTMGYFNAANDGLSNTKEGWERRREALLTVYYLWNIPGMTVLTPNFNIYPGSGNTDETIYYKTGVPYEMASQPTKLLEADIGTPSDAPTGYAAVPYLGCSPFDMPLKYCNTIIGRSNSETLTLNGYGSVKTLPTNQYLLYSKNEGVDGTAAYLKGGTADNDEALPADMVIGRSYTNGLVLYRTSFNTITSPDDLNNYINSNKITVSLPGLYQRVLPDGTLAEPSSTIELRGYEGAILKKAGS